MFHVPVVKNGENGHLRQRGKVAELALGYGGSVGALKAMDAVRMGIPEGDLKPLVDAWREANPPDHGILVEGRRSRENCDPLPHPAESRKYPV